MMLFFAATAVAAPIWNAPALRLQPNGDTLRCLLSGDEYYHRLHDARGYTIVQNPRTGWWVYADTVTTAPGRWDLVATNYVAGSVDPAEVGLTPNTGIDREAWAERQHRFDIPKQAAMPSQAKTSGRNHGVLNNIVIFVRFSDDSEISTQLSTIDAMFNDSTAGSTSMYNYYRKVSYGKLSIPTLYYPTPNGNSVVSYQDLQPRNYYMPYDATTNPTGYQDDNERASREFGLLERAVNYVNANSPIATSVNLDMDNDGAVDNICFVVKGTYTGWSDLLWPHKWALYDRYVYINGKRVYTFNLQLEGSGDHYFSSSTFCHEMFHTLGAPDLYRYEVADHVTGVGSWDLMCSNTTPPQTMGAYMKWKYGNWIDSVPEITIPGTYTLHSLGDSTYDNIVYKIAAQEEHQWYVLEYRDNTEQFETTLPGKGLLIYRIDDRFNGNAGYDGVSTFDEVYLFRPGAPDDTTNGYPAQAFFSANAGRTSFSPTTDPRPWLTGNVLDSTISITAIGTPGQTITFTYNDLRGCSVPVQLRVDSVGATAARLKWSGRSPSYRVYYREVGTATTATQTVNGSSCTLVGLDVNTHYEWCVKGLCSATDISDFSDWSTFKTATCNDLQTTEIAESDLLNGTLPLQTTTKYSYAQMLFNSDEIDGAMAIDRISFNYASDNSFDYKTNCVVYLGMTDEESFPDENDPHFIPFRQLQKVYEGPFNFSQGWNELTLDSTFLYDGVSTLVVAVDDNTGVTTNQESYFHCTQTPGQYKSMVSISSTNLNPETSDTDYPVLFRKMFRADIRLMGCPEADIVSILTTIDGKGRTAGDGGFHIGDECTLTATPKEHWHFVNWTDENGNVYTDNPHTFTVDAQHRLTAHFAIDQHHVSVTSDGTCSNAWFQLWFYMMPEAYLDSVHYNEADIDHNSFVYFFAEPVMICDDGTVCRFVRWSDGSTENPNRVVLKSDIALVAQYDCGFEGIDEAEESVSIGVANSAVTIVGAEGREIEVLDITGRTIARAKGQGHDSFALPAKGVYVIRIEGLTTKKIVNISD